MQVPLQTHVECTIHIHIKHIFTQHTCTSIHIPHIHTNFTYITVARMIKKSESDIGVKVEDLEKQSSKPLEKCSD